MITEKSKKMMTKSFEKTIYRFTQTPDGSFTGNYGIYVHVPFCQTKCAFCPFYKEVYSEAKKELYIDALISEIGQKRISGRPYWIYFGGGTPNILSIDDVSRIVATFKKKIEIPEMGIEILPKLASRKYIAELRKIGFSKISFGIETLQKEVLNNNNRDYITPEKVHDLIGHAKEKGFWVNVDMMVGLRHQTENSFMDDINRLREFKPSQITTYPYMIIRNSGVEAGMTNKTQFELIEKAGGLLRRHGYERKGIWIFADGTNIYDSSRDELVTDYAGFGPAAFSTYGNWKVVNPDLDIYLKNHQNNTRYSFVAPKSKATDDWRQFARMIYDLRCFPDRDKFPFYINAFIRVLTLLGYAGHKELTAKGVHFAHEITKTVVESLPFPLQNEHIVENYEEYLKAHE